MNHVGANKYRVKNSAGFNTGDVVIFDDGATQEYSQVVIFT